MDKNINIDKIKSTVQLILNKNHKLPEKRKMICKLYGSRPVIEMACPICGDSSKNTHKKRGNLYLNNLFYVCYNCGTKMNYVKFVNNFGFNIDINDKIKLYEIIDKNNDYVNDTKYDLSGLDKIMDLNKVIDFYNKKKDKLYNISPLQKNSIVDKYLRQRKIFNDKNIYEGLYKITDKWIEPVLIILNKYDDKLLSFQLRNLKSDKKKRLYKIYDFQTIYNYINEEKINDEEAIPYNKLSHLYNILNIDFYKKITIFEGYLDSTFCPNSIGTTGVDTDYSFLTESEEIDIRFFYDYDKVGKYKTLQKLKEGYSVFLWNKLFKNISKGNTKLEYKLKKSIKDLNELAKTTKDLDIYNKFKLEEYFSIDEFDKIWL